MRQKLLRVIEMGWRERIKFAKYAIVGVSGFAIDMSLLLILVEWFHLEPKIAVIINYPIALGFNFLMNKHWSFGSNGESHKELARYLSLAVWNYLFAVSAMYFGNEVLGLPYLLVRVASIACMVLWNFLLFRFWVYRENQEVKS